MNRPQTQYIFAAGLTLLLGTSQAQTVAAGTQITNQAQVTFQYNGGQASGMSNIVSTTVQSVCGLSITPNGSAANPGQSTSILPDETATLTYQVQNTGNDFFDFTLTPQNLTGDAANLSLHADTNGDGRFDEADTPIRAIGLSAGEMQTIFIRAAALPEGRTLVDLVGQCPGGQPETGNVGVVEVAPSPSFSVTKTFDREVMRPGDQTQVTLRLSNGGGAGREVWLTDDLATQLAGGLSYVAGSARSNAPIEYTADGLTWSKAEPATVRGIRAGGRPLATGQEVSLSFDMRAEERAENASFTNTARAISTLGGGASASDSIEVRYAPNVAIGPVGQPLAQGEADVQRRKFALTTSDICFDHTVRNTGDVQDDFGFALTYSQGSATAVLRSATGEPLAQPLSLAAGAESTVQVCYQGATGNSLEATLTVNGERGSSDTTSDIVERLETQLPEVTKTVRADVAGWEAGNTVETGNELTYTLRVRNPYQQALTGVTVTDVLPGGTVLLAAEGAQVSGQTLTWNLGNLPAEAERELTVRVRVTETADDAEITNVFSLTNTLFPDGITSNAATVYTWNSDPTITKVALQDEVTLGEHVSYQITIFNTSETAELTEVLLHDSPSRGLNYVAGTSRLNGQPVADPAITDDGENGYQKLRWSLPNLPAGASAKLTYDMLVTPEASEELLNTARLRANGSNGALDIASSLQQASTTIRLLNFAPLGDILGQVFIDSDADGQPDKNEMGVQGARILLAGGRSVVTDAQGRYHFGNVPFGTHALRLDEASTGQAGALAHTGTLEAQGHASGAAPATQSRRATGATRLLQVRGLNTEHFALQPKASNVGRALEFQQGDIGGELTLWPVVGRQQPTVQAEARLTNLSDSPVTLRLQPTLPPGLQAPAPQTVTLQPQQSAVYTYTVAYSGPTTDLLAAPTLEVNP